MANRKLGKPTDQRMSLLRNQTTQLLWYGKLETTLQRAKEIRRLAEKMITLAVRECDNTVEVSKETNNEKGQTVTVTVVNDKPTRLAARRQMMAFLYEMPHDRKDDESKSEFRDRTKANKHPVVEKILRDYGPKYKKRAEEKGIGGGYTRILRMGPRRGDGAEKVIIELV